MATTVDTLLVRIEADLGGLRRDLQRVERTTKQSSDKMGRSLKSIDSGFSKIGRTVKALAPILAGALGVGAVRGFIRVGAQVENLRVRLRFLFGDVEEGAKAFDVMARFASKVPFSLQQIQNASGTLASVAKNAAELNELLVITGNVAAVSGLGFAEAAGNLQRAFSAGANSADLFRERGILALAGFEAGAKVSVDETIKTFQKAFGTGGEFDGATNALAETTDGLLSMLGDAFFSFQRAVVDAGLLDAFKELTVLLTDNMKKTQTFAQVLGRTLAAAIRGLTKVLGFLLDNLRSITIALTVFLAVNVAVKIAGMVTALYALSKALVTARIAQVALNKAMLKNPFILGATGAILLASELGALDGIFEILNQHFEEFFDIADVGTGEIAALDEAISGLGTTSKAAAETDLTKTITSLKEEAKMANAELAGMDAAFIAALKSAGGLSNIQGNQLSLPKDEKEANTLGVGLTGDQVLQIEKLVKANKKATSARDAHNTALEEGKAIAQEFIPEQEILEKQLDNVRLAMRGAATEDLPLYEKAIKDLQFQIKMTNPQFEALHSAAMQAADGISNALADAFVNGKLSLQSLGDIFKQVVKQMIADAIKAQIVKFLMGSIFGAAGGGSVSSFGGSGNASQANSTLSHAGGGAISRYGRAGGGMAMPTLVGERGPELFVPHTAGVVRNNHDTKNMMGGGSPVVVNQNINIETGVAQTVRAEVMSMMPRIKSETIQAMIDGKRRGNSISKAFA
jgi:hypothetical protein